MAVQKFAGKLGIAGAVIGGFAAAVGFVIGLLKQSDPLDKCLQWVLE